MKLFIEGHAAKKGYAISVLYSDDEIRALPHSTEAEKPVRFNQSRDKAFELVERFNKRFATH